ncbi:t-complex protein 1 subunit delta [Nephila pilipes]|uniref:T-complex protein 1 subunit delta n=1 Tax=Nephila pilipes TaxID=299642 RepID=A0A8X6R6K1_NEPPI|nr:t-complex protein 1 subunit delta [Nephila pilipes]
MNKYSTDVRVFIVLQMARCDENVKAVQRAWQEKFHNKNWPNKRTMARLYAKFKRTGSVEDDKKAMAIATATVVTDGAKQVVDDFFAADPTRFVRRAAEMLGIKRTSLQRIMKELELSPYKIQVTQHLNEDHTQRRSEFAQLMLEKLQTELSLLGQRKAGDHCCPKPPPEKISCVVCNILAWCIWPYFHRWNSKRGELQKVPGRDFIPFLHGHDLVQGHWFMQDGARPHRTADVFEVHNEHFSDRIIGLDYPSHFQSGIEWLPYSSDLNPCDYYLWSYLKSKVWQTSPTNLPELKTAITTAVDTIDSEACSRVMVGFQNHLTAVLVKDGGHFEPLYH